jgi:hypothetical protein
MLNNEKKNKKKNIKGKKIDPFPIDEHLISIKNSFDIDPFKNLASRKKLKEQQDIGYQVGLIRGFDKGAKKIYEKGLPKYLVYYKNDKGDTLYSTAQNRHNIFNQIKGEKIIRNYSVSTVKMRYNDANNDNSPSHDLGKLLSSKGKGDSRILNRPDIVSALTGKTIITDLEKYAKWGNVKPHKNALFGPEKPVHAFNKSQFYGLLD